MKKYIFLISFFLIVTPLFAQEETRTTLKQRASDLGKRSAAKYIFAPGTDALLMSVKVWGEVKNPGIYDVPIGMDLIELLSSAGGPTGSARLSKVKIIRAEVENENDEKNEKNENEHIFSVNVREFLNTGNSDLIPIIRPGDTVVVPLKPYQYVQTTISYSQQYINLFSAYAMIYFYYLSQKE